MSKFKKITAVFLSVIMLVCCFTVSASAESIYDTASAISSGKSYSTTLYSYGDTADYKITANQAGALTIDLTSQLSQTKVYVYDADGNDVELSEAKDTSGATYNGSWYGRHTSYNICEWNNTIEKYVGTLTYKINKGTYYIRFENYDSSIGKISFKATVPTKEEKKSKISYLQITMPKGSSIQLSAVGTVAEGDTLSWSSSKTSVATVTSKGVVTAKAAGTAIITAKLGTSTMKLRVKVTS